MAYYKVRRLGVFATSSLFPGSYIGHKHGPRPCNIRRGDSRRQPVTAEETRYPKGAIPAHQGVSTKIAAVNCQQERVAPCGCAVWRDRAYKRSQTASAAC